MRRVVRLVFRCSTKAVCERVAATKGSPAAPELVLTGPHAAIMKLRAAAARPVVARSLDTAVGAMEADAQTCNEAQADSDADIIVQDRAQRVSRAQGLALVHCRK